MAEYNPHPIPGFIVSLRNSTQSDRTYRSHECPDPVDLIRIQTGGYSLGSVDTSQRLSNVLATAMTGFGDFIARIDPETDLVYIQSWDAENFQLLDGICAQALGFRNFPVVATAATDGVTSVTRIYATADWQRGDFEAGRLAFILDGPTACNTVAQGRVSNLMAWMGAVNPTADAEYRFGLTTNGHVFFTTKESPIPSSNLTNPLLGFDGTEVGVNPALSDWTTYTANHPCAGVWVPSRPLARRIQRLEHDVDAVQRLGGDYVYALRGAFSALRLEAWLDGPMDVKDLQYHFLEWFTPYAHAGASISFYPRWGDPRVGVRNRESGGADYTLTTQTYQNGEQGALYGALTEQTGPWVADWPLDLRRRAPITLEISLGRTR